MKKWENRERNGNIGRVYRENLFVEWSNIETGAVGSVIAQTYREMIAS